MIFRVILTLWFCESPFSAFRAVWRVPTRLLALPWWRSRRKWWAPASSWWRPPRPADTPHHMARASLCLSTSLVRRQPRFPRHPQFSDESIPMLETLGLRKLIFGDKLFLSWWSSLLWFWKDWQVWGEELFSYNNYRWDFHVPHRISLSLNILRLCLNFKLTISDCKTHDGHVSQLNWIP